MSRLHQLECLNLTSNILRALPPALLALTGLTQLALAGNRLEELPSNVGRCFPRLKTLDLSTNRLQALPDGLWGALPGLEECNVARNRLQALPDGLACLSRLTSLQVRLGISSEGGSGCAFCLVGLARLVGHVPLCMCTLSMASLRVVCISMAWPRLLGGLHT